MTGPSAVPPTPTKAFPSAGSGGCAADSHDGDEKNTLEKGAISEYVRGALSEHEQGAISE